MDEQLRVDGIVVRELRLPLRVPFRISGGAMSVRRSLVVELHSDGVIGYGESAPFEEPFYSEETLGSVLALYRDLYLPRLVGRRFASIDDLDEELRRGVRGNPFARAGLETAAWDLCCSRSGVPLVEAIADRLRRCGLSAERCRPAASIESGVAVGIPDDERLSTLERRIAGHAAAGYRRVKIKIRPGWDVEACRSARRVIGDSLPLWTDANASYTLPDHLPTFQGMEGFGLLMHEQPLHHRDLLDHSLLASRIRTPICLDESLTSLRSARAALRLGSARIWNVKVQRIGGLTEAVRIVTLAERAGVRLWGGTMPESGIGAQTILALAAFPPFVYPSDVEPSARWYEEGLDPVEITMSTEGRIAVPREPGVAARLDLPRYRSASRELLREFACPGPVRDRQ